jgi:hypothetical protein
VPRSLETKSNIGARDNDGLIGEIVGRVGQRCKLASEERAYEILGTVRELAASEDRVQDTAYRAKCWNGFNVKTILHCMIANC